MTLKTTKMLCCFSRLPARLDHLVLLCWSCFHKGNESSSLRCLLLLLANWLQLMP